MTSETAAHAPQQRLGRRLGLEPYYTITERTPERLRLESRPEANQGPGRRIMAGGVALIVVAALIALSAIVAAGAGAGFASAAFGAVLSGLIGAIGFQRAYGGYAVATTRNSIAADTAAATVTFTQGNAVAPERTQRLAFAHVAALRLRRRPFATGALLKRARPVVALEIVTVDQEIWIVDSAEDPEQLRELALALSELLEVELARG